MVKILNLNSQMHISMDETMDHLLDNVRKSEYVFKTELFDCT